MAFDSIAVAHLPLMPGPIGSVRLALGFGWARVQIDVGDDGIVEAMWHCGATTQQQTWVGTAIGGDGLRIRIRATGAVRSWTASTPYRVLLQFMLDCVPAGVGGHGRFEDCGVFDLESPLHRATMASGHRPSLAVAAEAAARRDDGSLPSPART